MSRVELISKIFCVSLCMLGIIFSFAHTSFACSPTIGSHPERIEATSFFIKTSSLGPDYINLNQYIPIRKELGDSCGPYTTYARALPIYAVGGIMILGLIYLGMRIYNIKRR